MYEPIDLSKEFHPVPKPTPKGKKPVKPLKQVGKKTKQWTDIREILKDRFKIAGITSCEIKFSKTCWNNNALSFAHLDKRRNLTIADLHVVVLACVPCHQVIEAWPAAKMRGLLERIIKARIRQP